MHKESKISFGTVRNKQPYFIIIIYYCFLTRVFLSRNSVADLTPVQPEDCKTEIGSRYWGLDPGSSTMLKR